MVAVKGAGPGRDHDLATCLTGSALPTPELSRPDGMMATT